MARQDNPSPAEPGPRRWFLVANSSRARAYVQRVGSPGYDVLQQWDSPTERMTSADRGEDRPDGPTPGRTGKATESVEAVPSGAVQRSLEEALVEDLSQALRRRELEGLYLVAPAALLHRLRDSFPTDLKQVLMGEHSGDFTQRPAADVFQHLDALRRA